MEATTFSKLRPFQREDATAVLDKHRDHQCVIGRAATGLGKAVEVAALAQHYSQFGRVMVLVDVKKLVRQLASTVKWYTGMSPGIEMGDEESHEGGFVAADRIVVSTVQTQYSGEEGDERYRKFDPSEFSALLLDECELFLAPKARSVVEWYKANPSLRVFGCTATPLRTDGVAMANLFTEKAFDRDILWGIDEGWLVPARQAFVRVSVDFSSLKLRENEEGEMDYSEKDIAARIENEKTQIELAKGIVKVAEGRTSIVVCPTVETAKAVAHYIDAEKPGSARSIYGEMPDNEKDDTFAAFDRCEFQFLVSVMMLTKGFDHDRVSAVFMCRKTKSKRLYTQVLGRGTRPLKGIIEGLDSADLRRNAITSSAKPNMLMVNMVGIDDAVRDVTIVDILGKPSCGTVADRAKELMAEDETLSMEDAVTQAEEDTELEREAALALAEIAEQQLSNVAESEEKRQRQRVRVDAHVDIEYSDDLRVGGHALMTEDRIPERTLETLRRNKVPDSLISKLSVAEAKNLSGTIMYRHKAKLCSYAQGSLLKRWGYTKEQVQGMSRDDASAIIEERFGKRERAGAK